LPSPSLVLFDIDGTLVRGTGPYHPRALAQAVRDVTGVEATTEGIPIHGMLDSVILTVMLQRIAVPPEDIPALIMRIGSVAEEIYLATVPDLRDKTCPGVPALLEALTARHMVLALVTGNLTRIGWRKLERAGVHHHFRYGAFGEMAETRSGLAAHAIDWARREGVIDSGSRISLIGDTPNDVRAARDNGIQAIGVRTGVTPQGEMEACGPDILLDDLTALDPLWL
jgi:phosphoglycolate phosphatase-like HAD superfamily hydrolase